MTIESPPPYQNNPKKVIIDFRSATEKSQLRPHAPNNTRAEFALNAIKEQKFGGTPETLLHIAGFLGESISSGQCTTTDLMIELFINRRNLLPERWRMNDDVIRTVVTMAANLDMAVLRNAIIHDWHDNDLSSPKNREDEEIARLNKLIDDLLARGSTPSPGQTV